jgi:hypothetical protein
VCAFARSSFENCSVTKRTRKLPVGIAVRTFRRRTFRSEQLSSGYRGIVPSCAVPHAVREWDAKRPGDSQAVGAQVCSSRSLNQNAKAERFESLGFSVINLYLELLWCGLVLF